MKFKYLLYTLPALLLASCSNDEPGLGSGAPGAAVVTANIGAVTSRASGTQWTADDRIGISGTTGSVTYTNVPYVTAAGDGTFAPLNGVAAGIFFQDGHDATFSAYYPYSADVTADNSVIKASTADQTQTETFDFLYATGAKGSLSSPALNFTGNAAFNHRMAQLAINLSVDRNDGFSEGMDAVTAKGTITLGGIAQEGEFNTSTGIASATGSASDFTLSNPEIAGNTADYLLILFPQTAENVELSIEYEGVTYSCTFLPTLAAGKRYTANITLRKSGLTVGGSEITDWESGDSFNDEASWYDPFNGHEAVLMRAATDTEPALYFATCNIGATMPDEIGGYFWWGDVEGHYSGFDSDNPEIITNGKTRKQLFEEGIIDANGNLLPEYDAASVKWGGRWRLPTHEDWAWLGDTENCTWTISGNIGSNNGLVWIVKSKSTGGEIRLRHSGYMSDSMLYGVDSMTVYGGATIFPEDEPVNVNNDRFYGISMVPSAHNGSHDATRTNGLNLRPVATL